MKDHLNNPHSWIWGENEAVSLGEVSNMIMIEEPKDWPADSSFFRRQA